MVGAGPTGLLLAGDLASSGVEVTLLERRDHESNLSRAFTVHARTMEELDARGLADELLRIGTPIQSFQPFGRLHIDFSRLHTRFPFMLITESPRFEWRLDFMKGSSHGTTFPLPA
ncbi:MULTISPECIES: FAD-dependent monooxygenase [unclassified Streptomyces]|uniref:FAD-dependent monooxygenase n=1 Tax=Streptomyces sp. NBC_01549 TaxID=2975874 RepID=UPI002B1CDB42|nr:FAD-dependent monooxygenase [Streptomyces sp. NBC_01549]